jgi:hypothetical protein
MVIPHACLVQEKDRDVLLNHLGKLQKAPETAYQLMEKSADTRYATNGEASSRNSSSHRWCSIGSTQQRPVRRDRGGRVPGRPAEPKDLAQGGTDGHQDGRQVLLQGRNRYLPRGGNPIRTGMIAFAAPEAWSVGADCWSVGMCAVTDKQAHREHLAHSYEAQAHQH